MSLGSMSHHTQKKKLEMHCSPKFKSENHETSRRKLLGENLSDLRMGNNFSVNKRNNW